MSASSGHLFIVRGDLAKIACDSVLVPTDENFKVEHYWSGLVTSGSLHDSAGCPKLDWGQQSVIALPDQMRVATSDGRYVQIWLGNVGVPGNTSGFNVFGPKIREFIVRAKAFYDTGTHKRIHEWAKPRFALPVVGSREGGGHLRRGDLHKELVRTLRELAAEHEVDIVLVTFSEKAYAAAQRARRAVLGGDDIAEVWRLGESDKDTAKLVAKARALAKAALDESLVLFLGSGVSVGAGLPAWADLLDLAAVEAGIDKKSRKVLAGRDARDYATLLERRLNNRKRDFRTRISRMLEADRHSLQHGLLASLPSKEAVTTNFDTLFELAAEAGGRELAVLPSDPADTGGRWLLKMHGSIGESEKIVLTRSDFLDMPRQYGALLGLVQGLLLMRHMMFVGYSLKDEDFHELIHEVRAARRGTVGRGTVLTLFRDDLDEELWSDDLDVVYMVDHGDGEERDFEYAGRQLEMFLDLVAYLSATSSAYFLDDTYEELVTEDSEKALRAALKDLAGQSMESTPGTIGYEVKKFLETLGADWGKGEIA